MALIACSECGRAVSDKATTCVGCGAPLANSSGINLVPPRPTKPPPTPAQIKRRVPIAILTLALGVALAVFADRPAVGTKLASFAAALLIIAGLSWLLVLLVHAASSRRR